MKQLCSNSFGAKAWFTALAKATRLAGIALLVLVGTLLVSNPAMAAPVSNPIVTAISPSSGPLAGGTSVTITGTNLSSVTYVSVGGEACTALSANMSTSITCTTSLAGGSSDVRVTTAGGTNAPNTLYTYVAAPTVTAISPSSGPAAGGTSVTITGTGFTGATGVTIGGQAGIEWTSRTSAADNSWFNVTYGNGLFVAVSGSGVGNRVMTSPDGITWTSRTSAANNSWISVTYGNGLFVAVAFDGAGNRVMTSPDGITWTSRTSAADNSWFGVTYGNGLFVAVSSSGLGNRVMTSGSPAATGFTVVSDTSITATTPPGAAGTASVQVTTAGGTNAANTLYTYVAPAAYSVTYNGNSNTGGSVPTDGNTYVNGASVSVLGNAGTLVKTGYTFNGWNTLANGGGTARAAASTFAMGGAAVTLYAQWTTAAVNGACASIAATAFKPVSGLCTTGTASAVSAASPWAWTCTGSGGGSPAYCSAPNAATATGSGTARASISGGTWVVDPAISRFVTTSTVPGLPPGSTFPHGLLNLTLTGGGLGATATVLIAYPSALPAGTVYWKYGRTRSNTTAHWYQFAGAVVSGSTITLTLTDGADGDDDMTANGVITDPGWPWRARNHHGRRAHHARSASRATDPAIGFTACATRSR